ncbi:hypothetical protein BIV57_03755 [Mangrovactinospora gilvigrisea]|uniref:Deaminase n=1 Tax=Mangrovactinospora gilvigrisea TaxID=1428644 RepID=A0A1J7BJU4_9ACTN|nr:YwqJ-related putative deaminase [Mangrovactinospora gilvigrisea]OIV38861.1 hypothetical protein BIV57_03755 [Mangrovactinospora gilvigrisea]
MSTSTTEGAAAGPLLVRPRESLLPTVAAALSVKGSTRTAASGKESEPPTLHPVIAEFLDALPVRARERWVGRCPEAVLLSRHLAEAEAGRGRRAARKPFTDQDARKALKGAKLTLRRIRETGDPDHGTYQAPCRSCAALLEHLGVRTVES